MNSFESVVAGSDYGLLEILGLHPILAEPGPGQWLRWSTAPASVQLLTATQFGPFDIGLRVTKAQPSLLPNAEHVVDFSARADSEVSLSIPPDDGLLVKSLDAGIYRVRISAFGRTTAASASDSHEPMQGLATEQYRIELWPAIAEPLVVHVGSLEAAPRFASIDPAASVANGVAACRRIGADLDGGPRARALVPGEAVVTARGRVKGNQVEVFLRFCMHASWSPGWDYGASSDRPRVGVSIAAYCYQDEGQGGDCLTGTGGLLLQEILAVDPQRYVKKSWELVASGAESLRANREDHRRAMPRPSIVEIHLDPSADGVDVNVSHSNIPEAWAADLAAFWAWQLDLAQQLGAPGRI